MLNMFQTLIYPSSGACDYSVEVPHWSYCSWFDVCWSFRVVGLEWYPCRRLSCASACNTDTTPTQPHRNSNTHRTKNNTTNVVLQQNSRRLLMMDILMSETCWAHKKWNKIASEIKLVFYSSTIAMMHGPINMRFFFLLEILECHMYGGGEECLQGFGGETWRKGTTWKPWRRWKDATKLYYYCIKE